MKKFLCVALSACFLHPVLAISQETTADRNYSQPQVQVHAETRTQNWHDAVFVESDKATFSPSSRVRFDELQESLRAVHSAIYALTAIQQDDVDLIDSARKNVQQTRISLTVLFFAGNNDEATLDARVQAAQNIVDNLQAANAQLVKLQDVKDARIAVAQALKNAKATLEADKKWAVDWRSAKIALREAREVLDRLKREEPERQRKDAELSARVEATLARSRALITQHRAAELKSEQLDKIFEALKKDEPRRQAQLKALIKHRDAMEKWHENLLRMIEELKRKEAAKQTQVPVEKTKAGN